MHRKGKTPQVATHGTSQERANNSSIPYPSRVDIYGPRQEPTLSDRQAAMLLRREEERRAIKDLMESNRSLGGQV